MSTDKLRATIREFGLTLDVDRLIREARREPLLAVVLGCFRVGIATCCQEASPRRSAEV